MYLGIDIGGTKTLVGCLDDAGVLQESIKFPTPATYVDFLKELEEIVAKLSTKNFRAAGVAVPGRLDREHGIALAFGNRDWRDLPIQADVERIVRCPAVIENDAKLAALSEALLLKDQYKRVLYITISTGIGTGVVQDGKLDPALIDAESGSMLLEHNGQLERWEHFASGKAIVATYGKQASEIHDPETWQVIAQDLALGIFELIAVIEPEVIVLGGAVSEYFERFQPYLEAELAAHASPLTPTPKLLEAQRPAEAVLYGCYDLAKLRYGQSA